MKDTRRVLLTILIGITSGIIGGATGIGGAFVNIPKELIEKYELIQQ